MAIPAKGFTSGQPGKIPVPITFEHGLQSQGHRMEKIFHSFATVYLTFALGLTGVEPVLIIFNWQRYDLFTMIKFLPLNSGAPVAQRAAKRSP